MFSWKIACIILNVWTHQYCYPSMIVEYGTLQNILLNEEQPHTFCTATQFHSFYTYCSTQHTVLWLFSFCLCREYALGSGPMLLPAVLWWWCWMKVVLEPSTLAAVQPPAAAVQYLSWSQNNLFFFFPVILWYTVKELKIHISSR
jgi:hypothetical protein